jgi:quinol monooxygenase YgiN
MVIVGGRFTVDPERREEFLAGQLELMRISRAEPGCLEYTFSADPLDPGRVVLFERWATQDALDAHLRAGDARRAASASPGGGVTARSSSIVVYEVASERPLRG